ncbi:MAG: hypothetical protein HW389_2998, partial [Bacteroidetes bacterium]|nr:hypothetical protein [Bacteroidota bacterium]
MAKYYFKQLPETERGNDSGRASHDGQGRRAPRLIRQLVELASHRRATVERDARGVALETLVLQHLRAVNDYGTLGYSLHYWRTAVGEEVDFVLYGERGMHAFEVKSSARLRQEDFRGLHRLREDYPAARAYLLYPGTRRWHERGVEVLPLNEALPG